MPITIGARAVLDAAFVAFVAEHWQLGSVAHVRDIGGTYNLNMRVQTDRGAFVVRVHRPWVTAARLALLQRIKHVVARQAVPVALSLPAANGVTMIEHDGRLVEVEPFVAHDAVADSWQRYEAGFAMLGTLHGALDLLGEQIQATPPLVSNYGTLAQLIRWTAGTREQIQAIPDATSALAVCDDALALLVRLQKTGNEASLPHVPTHGDYGGGNLLFRGDQIVAVLDFDFVGVRPRVFDVAYSLFWMFRRVQPDDAPERWQWQQILRMLAAYNSTAPLPLTTAEEQILPLTMARVPLYWIAEAGRLADPLAAVLLHTGHVQMARWLAAHGTTWL